MRHSPSPFLSLLGIAAALLFPSGIHAQSDLTANHSASSFTLDANGSSPLGTATLQSGADMQFGSSTPAYTIAEGHDILLGRSLGEDEAKLRVALKSPATLAPADLAGTWIYYDFEVDEKFDNDFTTSTGTVTIQSGGTILFDGSPAGSFSINASRHCIVTADGDTIDFAVNASKDLMLSTSSEPGMHSLIILVRPESGGSTSQMADTWTVGSFAADFSDTPPNLWYDGDTMTAAANGALTFNDGSATWSANGSGNITFNDPEGSTTLAVSLSRNVLAYTETAGDSPDQTFSGALVARHATSPSIASLAGDWTLLSYEIKAATGNGDPNTVETFHPDGTTRASRERFANGQLDGQPARETWNENGNPTLVEDYTAGALTNHVENSYHVDGETLSLRTTTYPTEDGQRSTGDAYAEDGTQTSHSSYLDGQRDGLQQEWFSNGNIASETLYARETLRSRSTWTYHPNGQASAKQFRSYTTGVETLEIIGWRQDGTKASVSRFQDNELHGVQEIYDANENLISSRAYVDGVQHGPFRLWFDGGTQLQSESFKENGKLHGLITYWNEDGTPIESQEYKDDLRHGERRTYSYHLSGGKDHEQYTIWNYGEERYREDWWWHESNVLNSHSFAQTAGGDFQADTPPDYSLNEIFDEQGSQTHSFEFRNGALDGVWRRWTEGILEEETFYKEDQFHGRKRFWNSTSGNIESDQYYENGQAHGPYKLYDDGTLTEEGTYALGLREGIVTKYPQGTTTSTYLHDILHGPYASPTETGNYENGLREGTWSTFSEGALYQKTDYSKGSQHGTHEYYSGGQLNRRDRYTNGQRDGLQETFYAGNLSSDTTFALGLEVGPRRSYHPNGQLQNNTSLDGGLAHGSSKTYDAGGRITASGSYNHGAATGTWTTTSYDAEGKAKSDSTNYGVVPPDQLSRGIKGTVTSGGVGVANVQLQLTGASATTAKDGTFFLDLSSYNGPSTLTLTHQNFPDKTVPFTPPADYAYTTQNVSLDEHTSPALALGDPDMPGTYFLRDSNFTVYFPNLQRPGGDNSNRPDLLWRKPNGNTDPNTYDLNIKPGIDANDAGYAGVLFTRSAPGLDSDPLEFPTYNISPNPLWAQKLGGWESYWEGEANTPGEYRMIRSWPPEPLNIGISRDTVGEILWPIWSSLPVIGSDLGLFDVQFKLDAAARTDGTGEIAFGGHGEIRAAKKNLRIEADGQGLLLWKDTLELSKTSVLLRGTLSAKETIGTLSFFPVLKELEKNLLFGGYLKRLNQIAKIELELGGGVGGRFPIDALNGDLQFAPTELELNFLSVAKVGIKWFPLEVDLSHKSVGRALFDPTGPGISLKSLTLDGTSKAKLRIFDFKNEMPPLRYQITYPTISSSNTNPLIQPFSETPFSLITPDFVNRAYARYESRISLFSEKVGASSLANTQPDHSLATPSAEAAASNLLVSNIYPHANPVIAQQGSTRAIAYIHFDPARPAGQSTRLYASFDTGNGFSEPAPIHTQNQADFNPQLAPLPDGRFVAIWETSQLDQIATDIEERIQGLEIAWAIYTPNTQTWTAPALLSNNAYLDFNPIAAASANGLMLAWQSNADNQLLPSTQSPGQINITTWNGTGFQAPTTLPAGILPIERGTLAYDGTKAVYAYIGDADQDPSTVDDSELYFSQFDGTAWSSPIRATNNQSIDTSPRAFCLDGDTFELVWRKDNDLLRMDDFDTLTHETIRDQNRGAAPTQFDVTCDAQGRLALIWGSLQNQQSDLSYALYDPDSQTWSDELALTNDDAFEAVPTFLLENNGKLLATYLSENNDTEQRDLRWLECELGTDLTVTSIQTNPILDEPSNYTIQASIRNLGALPSASATLSFYLGDPDSGGSLLNEQSVTLKGGEQTQVTTQASANLNGNIYIRIDPNNTIAELDETNNTASTALNPPALAATYFTWDRATSDETTLTLVGTVTNNGAITQTNIPVQITDESGILYSTTIPTLAPSESADITTTLTNLISPEYRFTLTVDPANTLAEPDRTDNTFPLLLALRHLKDSDGDGMENAWEQLHFGTLTRDGRGDFDLDGLTDTFEFLTANDPLDPTSKFPFRILPETQLITFPSTLDRQYQILLSTDLETWTPHSTHTGTGQIVEVPIDSDEPNTFYRIQISLK